MKNASIVIVILYAASALAWDIDFSRRRRPASAEPPRVEEKGLQKAEEESLTRPVQEQTQMNMPPVAPAKTMDLPAPIRTLVAPRVDRRTVDRQSFVILNTNKGFVPSNVRIFRGGHYTVHIVNVNEDKKNVSFILDAFQQHHSTYFGKIKSFDLSPDQEGVFEFQCPETSAEGRLVVLGTKSMSPVSPRRLSSTPVEDKEPAVKEEAPQESAPHE